MFLTLMCLALLRQSKKNLRQTTPEINVRNYGSLPVRFYNRADA